MSNPQRQQGTVKVIHRQKGFGFIVADGGSGELFFHRSACGNGGWETLTEGQRVSFDTEESPKGPRAERIAIIG